MVRVRMASAASINSSSSFCNDAWSEDNSARILKVLGRIGVFVVGKRSEYYSHSERVPGHDEVVRSKYDRSTSLDRSGLSQVPDRFPITPTATPPATPSPSGFVKFRRGEMAKDLSKSGDPMPFFLGVQSGLVSDGTPPKISDITLTSYIQDSIHVSLIQF